MSATTNWCSSKPPPDGEVHATLGQVARSQRSTPGRSSRVITVEGVNDLDGLLTRPVIQRRSRRGIEIVGPAMSTCHSAWH
jgi:hypothetical protein